MKPLLFCPPIRDLALHCPRSGPLLAIGTAVDRWERPAGVTHYFGFTTDLDEVVVVLACPSVTPDEQWVHLPWTTPLSTIDQTLYEAAASLLTPGVCYQRTTTNLEARLASAAHDFETRTRWIGVKRRTRARQAI